MNRLTGDEKFTLNNAEIGISVNDYWRWAYSDLLDNVYRGVLAEFLVYSALFSTTVNIQDGRAMRTDWYPFDIASPSGRRVEVKSAAYLQSWDEDYHEHILFDIAPKIAWTPTDGYSSERRRNNDLYVFCLFAATSKSQSILNLNLWEFYVLPTCVLNEKVPKQKKIGLPSLMKLNPVRADFSTLGNVIETIDLRTEQCDEAT